MGIQATGLDPTTTRWPKIPAELPEGDLPYLDRLKLRPWEGDMARARLHVPPALLPEHCPVVTNWIALTGTSCAGKSTIIRELECLGFPVVHEAARGYVLDEIKKGRTFDEIRANDRYFRQHVLKLALESEIGMMHRVHELIFFDRASIDSLSAFRASGYDPHDALRMLQSYRFAKVYHFNPLPFDNDGLRTVNEDRRLFLDAAIERDYRALGYLPIRMPFAPVEERLRMILAETTGDPNNRLSTATDTLSLPPLPQGSVPGEYLG